MNKDTPIEIVVPAVVPNIIMNDQGLQFPEVCALTGFGRSTIYKYISEGKFPKPIKLDSKAVWLKSDILLLMRKLADKANAK